jgi:hypothetical protein
LIVRLARPLPIDPKMKFESRDVICWLGEGYCTLTARLPSTSGTAGSGGAVVGRPGAGVGAGDGVAEEPPQAIAAARGSAKPARKSRSSGMPRR